jgi:hypothetical protein
MLADFGLLRSFSMLRVDLIGRYPHREVTLPLVEGAALVFEGKPNSPETGTDRLRLHPSLFPKFAKCCLLISLGWLQSSARRHPNSCIGEMGVKEKDPALGINDNDACNQALVNR